uniref:HNH nuclease domain-containing protein n=1 Tax=Amicula sp. isolate GU52X-4 cfCalB7 TaxID=3003489 RepID=A0A9E9C262_9STRA|nr:hypothetical protein [Amicula sp. isolate GU52X-4 cfCalB7]
MKSSKNNELITLKSYTDVPVERFVKVKGERSPYDGDMLYWSLRLNNHPLISSNVSKLLKKQKGLCNFCKLLFFPTDIIERDHIIPLLKNGTHKINNMQLLHGHCHKIKTANDRKKNWCKIREAVWEETFTCSFEAGVLKRFSHLL